MTAGRKPIDRSPAATMRLVVGFDGRSVRIHREWVDVDDLLAYAVELVALAGQLPIGGRVELLPTGAAICLQLVDSLRRIMAVDVIGPPASEPPAQLKVGTSTTRFAWRRLANETLSRPLHGTVARRGDVLKHSVALSLSPRDPLSSSHVALPRAMTAKVRLSVGQQMLDGPGPDWCPDPRDRAGTLGAAALDFTPRLFLGDKDDGRSVPLSVIVGDSQATVGLAQSLGIDIALIRDASASWLYLSLSAATREGLLGLQPNAAPPNEFRLVFHTRIGHGSQRMCARMNVANGGKATERPVNPASTTRRVGPNAWRLDDSHRDGTRPPTRVGVGDPQSRTMVPMATPTVPAPPARQLGQLSYNENGECRT